MGKFNQGGVVRYSVVIPVFNEGESVAPLCLLLKEALEPLGEKYEIIFVDDGSSDDTVEIFRKTSFSYLAGKLKLISLDGRHGKSDALQAGFDFTQGEFIITLDGDLQDDPRDIPTILTKIKQGYDAVYGWRFLRQDPWTKKLPSKMANLVRRAVTGETIHDVGCALRVIRREVVQNIYLSRGMHRFLSGVVRKLGYRVTEVKVSHQHRIYGKTKYGFWDRLWEGSIDLIRFCLMDVRKLKNHPREYNIREVIQL